MELRVIPIQYESKLGRVSPQGEIHREVVFYKVIGF